MTLNPHTKLALDIIPIAAFFGTYKLFDLFAATTAMLALTLVTLTIIYIAERRIALAPLIAALVVTVFGGLTLYLHDETFIKIKPTLINLILGGVLLGGCMNKKGLIKHIFGTAFNLTPTGWYILSRRWGLFFLCMAILNECVWRNVPTSTWVNFKVFGLLGLTFLFALMQSGFIMKNQEKSKE